MQEKTHGLYPLRWVQCFEQLGRCVSEDWKYKMHGDPN